MLFWDENDNNLSLFITYSKRENTDRKRIVNIGGASLWKLLIEH